MNDRDDRALRDPWARSNETAWLSVSKAAGTEFRARRPLSNSVAVGADAHAHARNADADTTTIIIVSAANIALTRRVSI